MSAKIIDGNAIMEEIKLEIIKEVEALKAKGIIPGIATLLVGDNFPSGQVALGIGRVSFPAFGQIAGLDIVEVDLSLLPGLVALGGFGR